MADYALMEADCVKRTADGAVIPPDPMNADRQAYDVWVEAGGVPDPYDPPPEQPVVPTTEILVTLDQENRIRALEGRPPLTMVEFIDQVWAQMKP